MFYLLLGLLTLVLQVQGQLKGYSGKSDPSLALSPTRPVLKRSGEDALLTCIVENQGKHTLMWKKTSKVPSRSPSVLSANTNMVTSDRRMKVLHAIGGQVYVLKISNLTVFDAGIYFCEVNTDPPIKSFSDLTVVAKYTKVRKMELPTSDSDRSSILTSHDDNFSSCCVAKNVSSSCMQFCNIFSVISTGGLGKPEDCEEEFPSIVSCLGDGRDHLPCCVDAGIPEMCSDLCKGEFNTKTGSIKITSTCREFVQPTLSCIATGIETIPKQPAGMSADALNDTSILVSWIPSSDEYDVRDHYVVNITFLGFLTAEFGKSIPSKKAKKISEPYSTKHIVEKYETDVVIGNLEDFSVYSVEIWAENKNGRKSLPTSGVKVVTHVPGEKNSLMADGFVRAPATPDVRGCCIEHNVNQSCVDKFCDPHNVAHITQTDMMLCAPWDTEMFQCLADGNDHAPCCRSKGIPLQCQELCTGKEIDIDYRYFSCLPYMNELSSCLLEGYGVLPSSPQHFRLSNIHSNFAILHWDQPHIMGETVLDYVVVAQKIGPDAGEQKSFIHVFSPFILDQLDSGSTYEVYVEPVNEHGIGQPSSRQVFKTTTKTLEAALDKVFEHPYSPTQCCEKSGVKPGCLPLCSYNATSSQIDLLGNSCPEDFSKIVRCATAGRDHLPCCAKRFVPKQCQPLCQAVHQQSSGAVMAECIPAIEQIFQCFEEGTASLPPPVRDFKAISVRDGRVFLAWKSDDNDRTFDTAHYEVFYKQTNSTEEDAAVFNSNKQINTKMPFVKVDGLETGKLYRFFVVSRNDMGTSLPSSIVTLNVSSAAYNTNQMSGATSSPHQLELSSRSSTWLEFTWNPPAISHPEDMLLYRIYSKAEAENASFVLSTETDLTTARLSDLHPISQYELYVTSVIVRNESKIESNPSPVMTVWTDPTLPARVEVRVVKTTKESSFHSSGRNKPLNTVKVGGSMTVLCVATGLPAPRVIMSINGVELHSQITRHMITVVHNITKDVDLISCYANNGYGNPTLATKRVTVSRAPMISAPLTTSAMKGDTLTLKCKIDAYPAPQLAFFRDKDLKKGVTESSRVTITAMADKDDRTKFSLTMKVKNVTNHDGSLYYCHANNTLGEKTSIMGVHVKELPPAVTNVTDCCIKQNVTSDCLDICAFSIDFDTMRRKPQCIPQFQQLMACASDGSDHRHCCSTGGVPGICLNWCRGEQVEETKTCALEHSKTIIGCFHEGKENLPGPPENLLVVPIDASSAVVTWEEPTKNPEAVKVYRVFWRPVGAKGSNRSDIALNKLILHDLESGVSYEVVAKAGNGNGTSQLTKPVIFKTEGSFGAKQAPLNSSENPSNIFGTVTAVLLMIVAVSAVIFVLHRKNLIVCIVKRPERPIRIENPFKKADGPSVAFENPFYASQNPSTGPIQIRQENTSEDYNSYLPSSSESSSENTTPRSQEDTETKQSSLMDKMKSLRTDASHGQGFQRF